MEHPGACERIVGTALQQYFSDCFRHQQYTCELINELVDVPNPDGFAERETERQAMGAHGALVVVINVLLLEAKGWQCFSGWHRQCPGALPVVNALEALAKLLDGPPLDQAVILRPRIAAALQKAKANYRRHDGIVKRCDNNVGFLDNVPHEAALHGSERDALHARINALAGPQAALGVGAPASSRKGAPKSAASVSGRKRAAPASRASSSSSSASASASGGAAAGAAETPVARMDLGGATPVERILSLVGELTDSAELDRVRGAIDSREEELERKRQRAEKKAALEAELAETERKRAELAAALGELGDSQE